MIEMVLSMPCATPKHPEFKFKISAKAASHNLNILSKYYYNLNKALKAQQDSPLAYGKVFKPPHILKKIFRFHPLWQHMRAILTNGSKWLLVEISGDNQKTDLNNALLFGNHNGASAKPNLYQKLIKKDKKYKYSLPIPLASTTSNPELEIAPMNIMAQNMIDELGRVIPKDRPTHNQSRK
jgi:hypothetical protein